MAADNSIGFMLGRVVRLHHQRSHQHMGDLGLQPGQAPMLFALFRKDGQIQKDLAERLHLSPATVNVTLKRLEKAGLVERRRDANDQRRSQVFLTERGRSLQAQVDACIITTDNECLAGFTPEERAQFAGYLQRLAANLTTLIGSED